MVNHMVKDIVRDMVKNTANKKHYPPSYYRYRENHPTVTLVLTKELKELLDSQKMDTDITYSQLLKRFINQASDLTQMRNKAYDEGYGKGMTEGEKKAQKHLEECRTVSLGKCSCGKPLVFNLNNPRDLQILSQVVSDSGVIHQGCPPRAITLRMPDASR